MWDRLRAVDQYNCAVAMCDVYHLPHGGNGSQSIGNMTDGDQARAIGKQARIGLHVDFAVIENRGYPNDGSFFTDAAKLWLFLPSGVLVFVLWLTGIYLWLLPWRARAQKRERQRSGA